MKKKSYVVYGLLWAGCTSAFGLPLDYIMPLISSKNTQVTHQREQAIALTDNNENHNTTLFSLNRKSNDVRTLATLPHKTA